MLLKFFILIHFVHPIIKVVFYFVANIAYINSIRYINGLKNIIIIQKIIRRKEKEYFKTNRLIIYFIINY